MPDGIEEKGASLSPIYSRLSTAGDYHPFTAETFADWSLQAGDVVTLTKDSETFQAPVYTSRMTWHGKTPQTQIETTGNVEREAVAKLGQKKHSGGGGGYRNSDLINTRITQNQEMILLEAWDRRDADKANYSYIYQTASRIRLEVTASNSALYAYIDVTASQIRSEVGNALSGVYSSITQTASQIRAEVHEADSALYSFIEITSTQIRSELGDAINGVYSSITQTASQIRAEVHTADSALYSFIEMTATQIRSEVGDSINGVYSSITQTASQIRAEVHEADSAIYSALEITSSQIRTEVGNSLSGVYSSITQTASQIRAEVHEADSQLYSSIEATASQIRSEVGNSLSGVYSSITQNADRIALVVNSSNNTIKAAEIVAAINSSGSTVIISADKINLNGYVTASELEAEKARFDNLTSGITTATALTATTLQANTALNVSGSTFLPKTLKIGSIISATVLSTSQAAMDFDHKHSISFTESNGQITATIGNAVLTGNTGNFNIAATQTYIDGVAAARPHSLSTITLGSGDTGTSTQTITVFCLDDEEYDLNTTVNASAVYNSGYSAGSSAGAASVTISNSDIVRDGSDYYNSTTHNTTIYIEATASNGAQGTQSFVVDGTNAFNAGAASVTQRTATSAGSVTLSSSDTGSSVSKTTTVTYDDAATTSSVPITINASSVYSAGQSAAGISTSWSNNVLSISRTLSGTTKSTSITITAGASISYDSTTHKYTATGTAKTGTTIRDSATAVSGTEAYAAGAASVVQRSVYSLSKVTLSSSDTGTSSKTTTVTYNDTNTESKSISIDASSVYSSGYTDGQYAAGISTSWSNNVLSISRTLSGTTKSTSITVTAGASISYNSSTHKYTATGTAKTGTTTRNTATETSGTEAYDAGYIAGKNDGLNIAYSEGWVDGYNSAVGKVSRTNNIITVPSTTSTYYSMPTTTYTITAGAQSMSSVYWMGQNYAAHDYRGIALVNNVAVAWTDTQTKANSMPT